jgi:hypothetical protein
MQKSLIFLLSLDPDESSSIFFASCRRRLLFSSIINEANLHLLAQLKQFKIISMELS